MSYINKPKSKPVQIVSVDQDHNLTLNERSLARILLESGIEDKNVCVVSVVGGFRQGKSFLLDFFIRYLENQGKAGWEGDDDEPLTGFTWRGGSKRETTGLWMWNEPFIVEHNGEEVAFLLLDTQGTFDTQSTMRENVTIFGLSTLISSLEIFNLMKQIREDDLQSLQMFTEYGRLIGEGYLGADTTSKPFQKLRFLVRDWYDKEDHAHGVVGGSEYLDTVLQIYDSQHDDLKSVRLHIKDCFEELDCFLTPHPGMDVVEDSKYDGRLAIVRQQFREYLLDLVQNTLSIPIVKKVNGKTVNARELFNYIVTYMNMFNEDDLPEPKTALQATALATHINATQESIKHYQNEMDARTKDSYVQPEELKKYNEELIPECLAFFQAIRKLGGNEMTQTYQIQLENSLEENWARYKELNEAKFSLSSLKTPISLSCLLVLSYIFSHSIMDILLEAIGLGFLLTPLDMAFWIILILLLFYMGVKAFHADSEAVQEVVTRIDKSTLLLWDKGLSNIAGKTQVFVQKKGTELLFKTKPKTD